LLAVCQRFVMSETCPNFAPAPNRRPRFPLGSSAWFDYLFCAPPVSPAAVGETRRSATARA
jgi:hypothetical protein